MVVFGVPIAIAASVVAWRSAPDRGFAAAALAISLLEALGLLVIVGGLFLTS
jgi:hypothetical protein